MFLNKQLMSTMIVRIMAPQRFPHLNLQNLGIYLTGQKRLYRYDQIRILWKRYHSGLSCGLHVITKDYIRVRQASQRYWRKCHNGSRGCSYGPMSQRMQVDFRSSRKLSALWYLCCLYIYYFTLTYQHHSEVSFLLPILKMVKLRLGVFMASELHHGHIAIKWQSQFLDQGPS